MDVGLLIYGTLATRSGGYLYDRQLVAHLRACGDRVHIVSLPWRSYGRHLLDNGSRALRQQLAQLPVDVLIQDELNHPSLAWLNQCGSVRYPLVALVHHLRLSERHAAPLRPLYRLVETRYLRTVDGFIFNSETTRRVVQPLAPGKPSVVAVPGGDHVQATEHSADRDGETEGPLRIVFVGNLEPRKGAHTLLRACASLPPASARVTLVGNPTLAPRYVRQLYQLARHATVAVRFAGALDDTALAHELAHSDVLVVPSQYEGYGIVYLEALAYGLPAIATTSGAAWESVHHGVNGFLIEPDDDHELAARLRQLANSPALRRTMRQAARQRYGQQPTWADSMERVRSFLLGLVAHGA